MRCKLLTLLVALLGTLPSMAQTFTYTYEGQTITYTVLDEKAKTVSTQEGSYDVPGNNVSGGLVLPAHPKSGNVEYTLTSIAPYSFYGCADLIDVILPETVTYIGHSAFYNCSGLSSVNVPEAVIEIDNAAFYGCSSLSWVIIPESVTYMGNGAFNGCSSLESVILPNSLTEIGRFVFNDCSALTWIEIPNSITLINSFAFHGCSSLTELTLPNSLVSIGNDAFSLCSGLTEVTIPASVTDIGLDSFGSCESLTTINVAPGNSSFTSDNGVLYNKNKSELIQCPAAKQGVFEVPGSVTEIRDYAFFGCSGLTEITVPNTVTALGSAAFYVCEGLTKINIPTSVTSIKRNTFGFCLNLSEITIPESVTSIENGAFYSCDGLTKVICQAANPPALEEVAFFIYEGVALYVPEGSLSAYQNSDWAKYFSNIKELKSGLTVEIAGDGTVYGAGFEAIANGSQISGSDFEFLILPDHGNVVSSITLDGQDITGNLVANKLTIADFTSEGDGILRIEFAPAGEAILSVKGADNHSFLHYYKQGSRAKIYLAADEGWEIHSVTYNGVDVTGQLEDNMFTTEPLYGMNHLNMVLISNGISNVNEVNATAGRVRISVNRNTVSIIGLADDDALSVYDLSGKTIYSGFDRTLTLIPGQVYILTTSSQTFKVAI